MIGNRLKKQNLLGENVVKADREKWAELPIMPLREKTMLQI